jgi:hypothetical protein
MLAFIVILSARLMVVLDAGWRSTPTVRGAYRAALAVAGGLAAVAFVVSAAFVRTRCADEPGLARRAGQRDLRRCAAGTPS